MDNKGVKMLYDVSQHTTGYISTICTCLFQELEAVLSVTPVFFAVCTQGVLTNGVTDNISLSFGCKVIRQTCSCCKYWSFLKPSARSNWKLAMRIARAVRASARARVWPIQLRGPKLKGFHDPEMLRRLPAGVASGYSAWQTHSTVVILWSEYKLDRSLCTQTLT